MAVNVRALTETGAVVAAVSYTVCAVLVALFPDGMGRLSTYILHMDIQSVGRSVTLYSGFVGGVLFTGIVTAFCAVSGWLYNWLAGEKHVGAEIPTERLKPIHH